MAAHSFRRILDIDTLVKVDPENSDRVLRALRELDARFREHDSLRPTAEDVAAGGHLLLLTSRDKDLPVVRLLEAFVERRMRPHGR